MRTISFVFTSAVGPAAASAALTATYPSSPSHSSSATLPSPQLLEMSAVRVSICVDGNEANGSSLQRERERRGATEQEGGAGKGGGTESQVLYIFVIMQRCRYVCVLYTNRRSSYTHICAHTNTHTHTHTHFGESSSPPAKSSGRVPCI